MYVFVVAAAAAALAFAVAAWKQPRAGVVVAAIVWLLYAVYEYLIANGTLCDANCNIRVDLILVWPLLWIASLFGIYARGQWTGAGKVLGVASGTLVALMGVAALYIMFVEEPEAKRAAQAKVCAEQGQNAPGCAPSAAETAQPDKR